MLNKLSGKFGKILFGMAAVSTIATSSSAINNNLFANETDKVEVEQKNTQGDSGLFDRTFYGHYVKDPEECVKNPIGREEAESRVNAWIASGKDPEECVKNPIGREEAESRVNAWIASGRLKVVQEEKYAASVHPELTVALKRSGVDESKIVYNIQDLYPIGAGEEFTTINWAQLNRNNPSTYMLAKNPKIAAQYVEFNRTTDEIKLITKTHDKGEEIVMKNGVVIHDTGLYNIDRSR